MADDAKNHKIKRRTAKAKFTRILRTFDAYVQDKQFDILKDLFHDLNETFTELEDKHNRYLELLEDNDGDDIHDDDYLDQPYMDLCRCKSVLYNHSPNSDEFSKPTDSKASIQGKNSFKVKKLDAPSFDGIMREYPSFKEQFDSFMLPVYGDNPYVLKSCLKGDALKSVMGVDNDFTEMFRRLDIKYGNPSKLVDSALSQIEGLVTVRDGDHLGLIEFVNTIEVCYLDLKRLKYQSEMNSACMISRIERLLPAIQKREWILFKQKNFDKHNDFESFLNFLVAERNALEYSTAEIRNPSCTSTSAKVNVVSCDGNKEHAEMDDIRKQLASQNEMLTRLVSNVNSVMASDSNVAFNTAGKVKYRCWYHTSNHHDISNCSSFKNLPAGERLATVKKNGGCFKCLEKGHSSHICQKFNCTHTDGNQILCNKPHHMLLHEAFVNGIAMHLNKHVEMKNYGYKNAIIAHNSVVSKGISIQVMYDSGANISLISHECAKKLNLSGKTATLSLTKVGNESHTIMTKEYYLPLKDSFGNLWTISVYGINELTSKLQAINVDKVYSLFSKLPVNSLFQSEGSVDVLLGTDNCSLLPNKIEQINNLQLLKGPLGYCIRGSYSDIIMPSHAVSSVIVNHNAMVNFVTGDLLDVCVCTDIKNYFDTIFNGDLLQNYNLKNNSSVDHSVSATDYDEMEIIDNSLTYVAEDKKWLCCYPWVTDPYLLPNNFQAAMATMISTEKRLMQKDPSLANAYDEQIIDMVVRGAARKLTWDELQSYDGPVHYISHHAVVKSDSNTTPLRIVFNSSSKFKGHCLNNYWAKGPDLINDMLSILMRFREGYYAAVGDIAKMYNSIVISVTDQHTHRFLWRNFEQGRRADQYVMQTVTFGDRPSSAIAILALRKTAEMKKIEFPDEYKIIVDDSYVDDVLFSKDEPAVVAENMKNIQTILSDGGFFIKYWTASNQINSYVFDQSTESVIDLSGNSNEKVLGMRWDVDKDEFVFTVKLCFDDKSTEGSRFFLSKIDVLENHSLILTRQTVLSQVAAVYDPLGLVTPIMLKAKILLRDLCIADCRVDDETNKWDRPVGSEMLEQWRIFFANLFDLEFVTFPRCVKTLNVYQEPSLVIFSDGSKHAYGACAYVRWQIVGSNVFCCNLIMAKNRVAPIKQISIPRLELCGALLGARLYNCIKNSMTYTFNHVFHIVDSKIVHSQIRKQSTDFNSYTGTRIGEIHNLTEVNNWYWVAGDLNPADLTTKPCVPSDLCQGSFWQQGPNFLKMPVEEWPVVQAPSLNSIDLPDIITSVVYTNIVQWSNDDCDVASVIQLENFNSLDKLLYVTACLNWIVKKRSFRSVICNINAGEIEKARILWIKHVQLDLVNWQQRFRRLGPFLNEDNVIVVGARISNWLKVDYNNNRFILLPTKHPFTKLVVAAFHKHGYTGVETTIAKIRTQYWIPQVRNLVKSFKARCIMCRKIDKNLIGQVMGPLPLARLETSPAFYHTSIDLFGPFLIRDTVKKRTHMKVFGVIFNCLCCRAIYSDLAEGYDTKQFLMVLRRFVTIHGYPRYIYSDMGSQLVSASKEMQGVVNGLNWSEIKKFGLSNGLDWILNKAADAPWENGCSEALIKSIKRCLTAVVGSNILTFAELQTVLFEVSNLINERPIGTKNCDWFNGTYLCPNDLLLGRSNIKVPKGPFTDDVNPNNRMAVVQRLIDGFWKRWNRYYFHTLLIRQKWHTSERNLCNGDIVIVQDSNMIRGNWRMAQVCEVLNSSDGKVRDVKIRYKNPAVGVSYNGSKDVIIARSVHRLVLVLPVDEQ